MRASPRVTVCVPTVGRLAYLSDTQASLAAQTYENLEVLVLDNGSPAEAQSVLARWAERDPRIRILRVEDRVPMFTNFNRGFAAATGEYLAYFHDDDVYLPTFIERHVEMLEQHPSAGIAGSNHDFIDEQGQVTERRRWIKKTGLWTGRDYIRSLVGRGRNPVQMPGIVYRRSAMGPQGIDDRLSIHFGDFVILLRIAETHDLAVLEEPLLRVRRHAQQASVSMPLSTSIPLRTRLLQEYCDAYAQRWPRERAFVTRLEQKLRRTHAIGLFWGWLSARDDREAEACLGQLDLGAGLADILRHLDHAGVTPKLRRGPWLEILRRLGNGAGV